MPKSNRSKRRALRRAEQLSIIYLNEADHAADQSSMELAQKLAAQSIMRLAGPAVSSLPNLDYGDAPAPARPGYARSSQSSRRRIAYSSLSSSISPLRASMNAVAATITAAHDIVSLARNRANSQASRDNGPSCMRTP